MNPTLIGMKIVAEGTTSDMHSLEQEAYGLMLRARLVVYRLHLPRDSHPSMCLMQMVEERPVTLGRIVLVVKGSVDLWRQSVSSMMEFESGWYEWLVGWRGHSSTVRLRRQLIPSNNQHTHTHIYIYPLNWIDVCQIVLVKCFRRSMKGTVGELVGNPVQSSNLDNSVTTQHYTILPPTHDGTIHQQTLAHRVSFIRCCS